MKTCALSTVKSLIVLGEPLLFSVRSADGTLLLARGQVIHDQPQLAELFERGALVDAEEIGQALTQREAPAPRVPDTADPGRLAGHWDDCGGAVAKALSAPVEQLAKAVDTAAQRMLSLITQSPEVAMSQVVQDQSLRSAHYGVTHSMNAATTCLVASRTLGWSEAEQQRAFRAALTMNLAMLSQQASLASQVSPLTPGQRKLIHEHPQRSMEMLQAAGISDADWLRAVLQHHEQADGLGYPAGITDPDELSQLLRAADVYTALMAQRGNRSAMSAQEAGRELYQMTSNSPLCQAVIKGFGVFPPGSFVRLASGEFGVVTRNGLKAYHPRVAALTTADGLARLSPVARDSARAEHAVVALVPQALMPVRVAPAALAGYVAVG